MHGVVMHALKLFCLIIIIIHDVTHDLVYAHQPKKTLRKLATNIVDTYVLNKSFVAACKTMELKESEQRRYITLDGRYMCR